MVLERPRRTPREVLFPISHFPSPGCDKTATSCLRTDVTALTVGGVGRDETGDWNWRLETDRPSRHSQLQRDFFCVQRPGVSPGIFHSRLPPPSSSLSRRRPRVLTMTMPPKRSASDEPSGPLAKQPKTEHPEEFSNAVKKKLLSSSRTGQACDRCKVRTRSHLPPGPTPPHGFLADADIFNCRSARSGAMGCPEDARPACRITQSAGPPTELPAVPLRGVTLRDWNSRIGTYRTGFRNWNSGWRRMDSTSNPRTAITLRRSQAMTTIHQPQRLKQQPGALLHRPSTRSQELL